MIDIWEPRYHDRALLIATYHLTPWEDAEVMITRATSEEFKDKKYLVPKEVIKECKVERHTSKKGNNVDYLIVPIEKCKEIKNEEK